MSRIKQFILEDFKSPICCKICGKYIKSHSAFGTHLRKKHKTTIERYVQQFFKDIDPTFKYQTCGFCKKLAKPSIRINYNTSEYKREYTSGFFCFTDECRNKICIDFFGKPYTESKKQYEHIGAKSTFLSLLYKKPLSEIKNKIKRKIGKITKECEKCSLNGFILRYGEELGYQKYKERNNKISQANTLEWYIKKFGLEDGTNKFTLRQNKMRRSFLINSLKISKPSHTLFNILKNEINDLVEEQPINNFFIDMFSKNYKLAIEFFGDFWHCNPKKYKEDFYNKLVHKTAKEIWEKDIKRINYLLTKNDIILKLIIVWESSFHLYGPDKICQKILDKIENTENRIIWI